MEHTAEDGKKYQIQIYNLDIILAVGYRTNSSKAIAFRQWATQILKSHITKGYTINRHRIKTHYEAFLKTIDDIKSLLPNNNLVNNENVIATPRGYRRVYHSYKRR